MRFFGFTLISLLAVPAVAQEITSPFYVPEAGHILSQTTASFTKDKLKSDPTGRTYHRQLGEDLTLGLGAGFSALVSGELNWTKLKQEVSFSLPRAKEYGAGLKGQWEVGGILTQLSALYRQTTNVDFEARRKTEVHLRLGKTLKTMTPYLHLAGIFPMNGRTDFNDNIYLGETGVFQKVKDKMTLDSAIYLKYDKNTKGRSCGIRGELSYQFTSWMALGLNGAWQARGRAKNHAHTYHQMAGIKATFAF